MSEVSSRPEQADTQPKRGLSRRRFMGFVIAGPTLIADSCTTPTIVCTKLVIVLVAALEQMSCAE